MYIVTLVSLTIIGQLLVRPAT